MKLRTDLIQKLLVSNEDKKPEEQLTRKDIVDILVVDHKIPDQLLTDITDSLIYINGNKSKVPIQINRLKNKKVLDKCGILLKLH